MTSMESPGARPWYRDAHTAVLVGLPVLVTLWALTLPLSLATSAAALISWAVFGTPVVVAVWLALVGPRISLALLIIVLGAQALMLWIPALRSAWGLIPLVDTNYGIIATLWLGPAFLLIAVHRRRAVPAWMLVSGVVVAAILVVAPAADWQGVAWWIAGPAADWPGSVAVILYLGCCALLGRALRSTRLGAATQRALESTQRSLVAVQRRLSGAEQAHALAEERRRITGEVHDALAHSLTVVLAQAEGSQYADAAEREQGLKNIAAVSRGALRDVRALIESLDGGDEEALALISPAARVDDLADLDALLAGVRDAGLDVVLESRGDSAGLDATAQAAAYRIVQEALTNALKHGDRSRAVRIVVEQNDGALEITVDSALRAEDFPVAAEAGRGIEGMRVRAAMVGGTLEAGPSGSGSWRVHMRMPAEREARS